jgi:hypothetical protein
MATAEVLWARPLAMSVYVSLAFRPITLSFLEF